MEFCTDSLHAMRVAIGATTKGKANRELKRRVRTAYVGLCERRGHRRVSVRHVYAHNRLAGNETADKLAKAGANDEAAGSGTDVLERAKAIYDELVRGTLRTPRAIRTADSGYECLGMRVSGSGWFRL